MRYPFKKNTRRTSRCGHAITHITGECTDGGRSGQERPHLLQSQAHYKGSQTKAAWVQVAQTYVRSRATLYQCVHAEEKGQEAVTGQEATPKRGSEENYSPFPKQYIFLLARGPLIGPQSQEKEGPCPLTPHSTPTFLFYLTFFMLILLI